VKLCDDKTYSAEQLGQIRDAIEDLYYFEFVIGKFCNRRCDSVVMTHFQLVTESVDGRFQ